MQLTQYCIFAIELNEAPRGWRPDYGPRFPPGEHQNDGEKSPEPDRQACGQPGALAANDPQHEPGEARRRAWADIPAGPEIRKGRQSNRRKPSPADFSNAQGSGVVFL